MMIEKTWTELKNLINVKNLYLQYYEEANYYRIFLHENGITYQTNLYQDGNDETVDFETNYKDNSNKPIHPISDDGKEIVRAESRPLDTTTMFTMRGDDIGIGDGKEMQYDFSNSDDEIIAPSGFKRKRIEFKFIDGIYVKEGTMYFHNAPKGQYFDFFVVCPTGSYYYKNDGSIAQASVDTPIHHFVIGYRLQGDCPMGDELNTEVCSAEIPTNYKFWIEVTTPNTDIISNGYFELEMYRKRTVIL